LRGKGKRGKKKRERRGGVFERYSFNFSVFHPKKRIKGPVIKEKREKKKWEVDCQETTLYRDGRGLKGGKKERRRHPGEWKRVRRKKALHT